MTPLAFFGALALTLAVELALAWAFFGKKGRLRAVLLANLITNPALNLLLALAVRLFGRSAYQPAVAGLESAALLAEARLFAALCGLDARKALAMSLALNAASFLFGLLIRFLAAQWPLPPSV